MSLLSFKVSFQCKRYKGSVSSGEIRNFRGSLGSSDRGLFITTGYFSEEAKKEAPKAAAPKTEPKKEALKEKKLKKELQKEKK